MKTTTTWREFLPSYSSNQSIRRFVYLAIVLLYTGSVQAQIDTLSAPTGADKGHKPHSVKKAVLYSSLVPGLGQAYNRKYWKIPIVYAALGTTGYFIVENHKQYRYYYQGLEKLILTGEDIFDGRFTTDNLIYISDTYRRWRDLSVILFVVAYGLNILDAYVDAHFYYYDISDNLSLNIKPTVQNLQSNLYTGLHFTLIFEATSKKNSLKNLSL